jgi:epoxide hydrolase-like predicted phosphatase
MIKAIIFDWGEVISEHKFDDIVTNIAHKVNIDPVPFSKILKENWREFHEGKIEEKDFWKKIEQLMSIKLPETESVWGDSIREVYRENKKMMDLLPKLKKNYKLAMLSNAEVNVTKIYDELTHLNRLFDTAVFSCFVNVAKPDRKIYEITLESLNVNPNESIFVDDLLENVEGANQVGINGIHFKGYEDLVGRLKELQVEF